MEEVHRGTSKTEGIKMYIANIRRKRSGVPILSKNEIDAITERMLLDYDPDLFSRPQELDIDAFAQNYLGAHQSYEYLSHCGVYLGMTVFNDTNRVEIYDPIRQRADYTSAKANTIIIDRTLLEEDQEQRYRFTLGHECGHLGLGHSAFFGYDPNQLTTVQFFGDEAPAMVRCRVNSARGRCKDTRYWNDADWLEWQADNFASCLLLPQKAIEKLDEMIRDGFDYPGSHGMPCLIGAVEKIFNVSHEAAMIRLRQLGYIHERFSMNEETLDFEKIFAPASFEF